MKKLIAALLVAVIVLIGILLTRPDDAYRSAKLMHDAASKCHDIVVDKKASYYQTPVCREIGIHAKLYLDEALNSKWIKVSTEAQLLYHQASATAFAALSLHNIYHREHPGLTIW
jgi:hypothetical protein